MRIIESYWCANIYNNGTFIHFILKRSWRQHDWFRANPYNGAPSTLYFSILRKYGGIS